MKLAADEETDARCRACRETSERRIPIAMAFQPIVDVTTSNIFGYEALVRGPAGEGARTVLSQVNAGNRYAFDLRCRSVAIETAVEAGLMSSDARLSINFLPNAIYNPLSCIQPTLRTARANGLPVERLILEFTEDEEIENPAHVAAIVATYRQMGFSTALDDFGAGHAGLTLLSRLHTDIIKLDMALIRDIDRASRQFAIVQGIKSMADAFGTMLIAEGVETAQEVRALRTLDIRLMQGFFFAHPAFRRLPDLSMSVMSGI